MPVTTGLSVVIPALNAAADLPATLAALGHVPDEVLVVDGSSLDGTARIAAANGARVIDGAARARHPTRGRRGRGDSDPGCCCCTRIHGLAEGWADAAAAHIGGNTDRAAYFRFALDSDDRRARRLERLVAWRCRALALPYGDQGLLLHRDLLRAVGGIRPLPLMEDVDLVRRLGRRRLVALKADAVTSAAKWRRDGWYRRSARNLLCLSLYFAGVPPRLIARLY